MNVGFWPNWPHVPYLEDLHAALARLEVVALPATLPSLLGAQVQAFHIHWPEHAVAGRSRALSAARAANLGAFILAARARNIPIVVTLHNLESHERRRPRLERRTVEWQLESASAVTVFSRGAVGRARHRFPRLMPDNVQVVPHGDWAERFGPVAPASARSNEIVFFGRVRPYKGLHELVNAFEGLEERWNLVVLGAWDRGGHLRELHARLARNPRVTLRDWRVPDADAASWLRHARLAVFPFADIENSGSVCAALAAGTPVLVPRIGGLAELADEVDPHWVRTYDPPLTTQALTDHLRPNDLGEVTPPFADGRRSWDAVARRIRDIYNTARHPGPADH